MTQTQSPTWLKTSAVAQALQMMRYPERYAEELATWLVEQMPLAHNKGRQVARWTANHGRSEAPVWYHRDELVTAIERMRYSGSIAQELADWFRLQLQAAFVLGYNQSRLSGAI